MSELSLQKDTDNYASELGGGSDGSLFPPSPPESLPPVVWLPDPCSWRPTLTPPPPPVSTLERRVPCCRDCKTSPLMLAVLAFLLWGIAFSLPYWITTPESSAGLWGFCPTRKQSALFNCVWLLHAGSWDNIVRGIFASGLLWCIVGIVGGAVAFCRRHPVGLRRFTGIAHILAALLILAALVVYTYHYFHSAPSNPSAVDVLQRLSVCFYAALLGCVLDVIAGSLYLRPLDRSADDQNTSAGVSSSGGKSVESEGMGTMKSSKRMIP